MNYKDLTYIILFGVLIFASCEDVDNPIEGVPTSDLFVQYAANVSDTVNVREGDASSYTFVVQAPISAGEDLVATVAFSGDATFGTDFTVSVEDDFDNDGLLSSSRAEATFTIPFVPTRGEDLVADQTNVTINFPQDATVDGNKELIVTLQGAVGSVNSSIAFAGGRGSIRRVLVVNIADSD
ncbi:MAG: hypothetical protein GDA37_11365 [Ekhidna sp.]|nr:hypothetical protein [Ekhidna sp.]